MGKGLSICRAIIEVHGGELSGEDGDSGGTAFCLTIPCSGEPAPGQAW
jgi:K+-sensing histidine kinase KdpD